MSPTVRHLFRTRTDSFFNADLASLGFIPRIYETLKDTVPFVTAHPEIFHCTHHPVIPESDLYFPFCSIFNPLSKRASK